MKWTLILSGSNSGEYNMNFDLELTNKCNSNSAFFRLYRWEPYCISLGANQKLEDIDINKLQNDGIDIVKRPTGGRAILHAEEITYSVVLPITGSITPKEIYEKISQALIKGLINYNPIFKELELENHQPNFRHIVNQPSGVLCFGSTAKNEIKYRGKKIVGSAQRKLDKIILQHGSILCGNYHRKLADYINKEKKEKEFFFNELINKTTEIESVTNSEVNYDCLVDSIVDGFKEQWKVGFENTIVGNSF